MLDSIFAQNAQTWARLYGEVRNTCDKGHEHPDDAAPIRNGERPGFNSHMSQRNFNLFGGEPNGKAGGC